MAKNNKHHRPELAASTVVTLRCRKVGKDDLETIALRFKWLEQEEVHGHRAYTAPECGTASAVAIGLEAAVLLSLQDNHEAAAKKVGQCLYALKRNRALSEKQNRRSIGSYQITCRDGQTRKVGDILEWYLALHMKISKQIQSLLAAENEQAELEKAQFLLSVAASKTSEMPAVKAA